MISLEGKKVVVVGLGKSGVAAARLAQQAGAQVTVEESKPEGQLDAGTLEVLGLRQGSGRTGAIQLHAGRALTDDALAGADLVVVSPGVPLTLPPLVQARERGKGVWGEVELAYRFLDPKLPLAGITGTNGKSTTTALTGELMRQAGREPFVGGNLGTALSEAALEPARFRSYVVELSSFQLEGVETFRANAAAILNLTPDHLDRYPSHQAYGAAKARIFRNQQPPDVAVINAEDADVLRLSKAARVPVFGFCLASSGPPAGLAGLARATAEGFRFEFGDRASFRVRNRALRGGHNVQNAMAAALLAHHLGAPPEAIQRGLDSYPGLPHRLESVAVLGGVEWINDSKATNVDSSVVALQALRGSRIWLIAGGKGKGAPYLPLKAVAQGQVQAVLTIGQDAETIRQAFEPDFTVHPCQTLASAVERAAQLAQAGDVVLLSPACASYDQFRNFEDRGETFKRLVNARRS